MNTSATDPATLRYYTDDEIACVVHQALMGLRPALRQSAGSSWWRATKTRRYLTVAAVQAVRRNADAAELWGYLGGAHLAEDSLDRGQRLKIELVRVIVATMAGSTR